MTFSRIVGTGRYLPERIMTNADLEKIVDTTDEWIRTRTGVERRHVVAPDQTTSDMCVEAAKKAMDAAGVTAQDIDLVITGTTTPDLIFPNISTIIQHRLGIPACTAFWRRRRRRASCAARDRDLLQPAVVSPHDAGQPLREH